MAYEKNKHLANIKKWKLDLSLLYESIYYGDINAPIDIKEFKGFKELCGFEISKLEGSLYFNEAKQLTSVSNLPSYIKISLSFTGCESLNIVFDLPEHIGEHLSFWNCKSLKTLIYSKSIYIGSNVLNKNCPYFLENNFP